MGCEAGLALCPDETAAVGGCVGLEVVYTCGPDGPVPVGCEVEQAAIVDCLEALEARCDTDCQAIVAAGCANGPPDLQSCTDGCDAAIFGCPEETADYMDCAGPSPTFTCTGDGIPTPEGCQSETEAVAACVGG